MQTNRQSHDNTEQSSTNQRTHLERLFEGSSTFKQHDSKRKDAYISDLINVQSLLNIRAIKSRRRKRTNSHSFQDRIIINVCGDRYETYRATLELYPETLLGNRKLRKYYFDKTRNEYFFDRNRACFEAILYYYQSHGRIRRPNFVPIDVFLEEVNFFQLGPEALKQLREDENIKEVKKVRLPKSPCRRHLWATMEYPDYSILAKIVNIISLLMVLVSTISLAIETLPQYEQVTQLDCKQAQHLGTENTSNNTNETIQYLPDGVYICHGYFTSPFFVIQTVCVVFFTIELLLRIIGTPSFLGFIKNPMNWIDIISVIPYYVSVGIYLSGRQNEPSTASYTALRLLRVLRFVRVLKFYRVFKRVKSLRVLASTLRESIPDFFIMITILTLLSFLFGAAAYFAEHDTNGDAYDSILKATYWGVITITSVGYGDIAPITPVGRAVACLCALFGSSMIGMLVSVLVDRYQRVFARKLYKKDEMIDFDDYSDDENNDTESKGDASSGPLRRPATKEIEDPDARARINATFVADDHNLAPPTHENPISRSSSRVHFIIGYVNDEDQQTSNDLLETINSVIAHKQTGNENIQLSLILDDQELQTSSHDVRFGLSVSSAEETDDDDREELTEIGFGQKSKGNVLKTFQCPPSPETQSHWNPSEKRV